MGRAEMLQQPSGGTYLPTYLPPPPCLQGWQTAGVLLGPGQRAGAKEAAFPRSCGRGVQPGQNPVSQEGGRGSRCAAFSAPAFPSTRPNRTPEGWGVWVMRVTEISTPRSGQSHQGWAESEGTDRDPGK